MINNMSLESVLQDKMRIINYIFENFDMQDSNGRDKRLNELQTILSVLMMYVQDVNACEKLAGKGETMRQLSVLGSMLADTAVIYMATNQKEIRPIVNRIIEISDNYLFS